ncbi:unnamed protein product, partial [Candidula unifasciata]
VNEVDGYERTALHYAAERDESCVRILLQVSEVRFVKVLREFYFYYRNLNVILVLLDYNADIDIRNRRGHTALQRSAAVQASGLNNEQDDATLELLIKASGQFDLMDEDGQPLSIIAKDNRLSEIMRPLCKNARSLLDLCRRQIRRSLGPKFLPNVIPALPVPPRLQEFLLLKDNKEFLCRLDDYSLAEHYS